ncbi:MULTISPECIES: pentapeptide repeat-containing protein [unclassified Arthrobacter]|uniref:pentapeptide repeat-containing protein n=1 Tax=unclassified Arthrobacter TaxID=235627 RepID=UPI001C861A87|nr:pentapeptide repeat-containing protein [Arthrobacter sp. MAHUQ-56]MBX7444785.1 pentapeptide repeat-containing protein [Arthrobacter sp. MAHUQ-56]
MTKRAAPAKTAAPRLSPVALPAVLDQPADRSGPAFRRGGRHDAVRYSGASADGLDLAEAVFAECRFDGASFNDAQLRGASFRDCVLSELYAPVFRAARSTWRDVEFHNPRLGSAELYESGWQSVRIDGGKLDFLNLRGAKLADVLITDCIINELDLGGASAARVKLERCTVGSLDLAGAGLKDFDIRGTGFRRISGLGSLSGLVIDEYQLGLLAPLLAAHLGVTVL